MGKHFHQFPALQLGKRAGFNDTYLIAYLGRGIFVMGIELLALLDDLLELGVRNAATYSTTMVLSILVEVTTPTRVLRRPGFLVVSVCSDIGF